MRIDGGQETLQNGTVYRRRGDSRKSITRASLTGFKHRCASLACGFAVEHLALSTATAACFYFAFSIANITEPFHKFAFNVSGDNFITIMIE